MENVNEGNRRFMKYNGPVYDGVEYKTPLFTQKDADTLNLVQNVLMDHTAPILRGSVPNIYISETEEGPSWIEAADKVEKPDKQKMKEIKLAALESSKSLTRLLELLREYDV